MDKPVFIGMDLASGPDVTVYAPAAWQPPKVVSLARYRKAKLWRDLARRLRSGEYVISIPNR